MKDLTNELRLQGLRNENARAWAEVDRLRAALREIADDPCLDPEGNRQIALRALNDQQGQDK